jgi:hypothetical protein
MRSRTAGQAAAALAALAFFVVASLEAHRSAIPAIRVYDGYWMILGAAVGMLLVGPLVWQWPRERSLVAILVTAVAGSLAPLVISALRHGMPLPARLRGAWYIGGADVVGPAVVIGCMSLWFALREHRGSRSGPPPGKTI